MSTESVSSIGEFSLIEKLVTCAGTRLPEGALGPGDDCAVLPVPGGETNGPWYVLTTDALVEGRHFDLGWSSFYDVGWKSLAANLSDVAAMGARPLGALVALHLPDHASIKDAEDLYRGLGDLARTHSTVLLGGDIVRSTELALSLTVVGICSEKPLLRSGASPGEVLWVTGRIGAAQLGLKMLTSALVEERESSCTRRHRRPEPRCEEAFALARAGVVSSMIDISDGLLQDAGHIAERSKVGIEIFLDCVRCPEEDFLPDFSLVEALTGGDDYELLFSVSSEKEVELRAVISSLGTAGEGFHRIGQVYANGEPEVRLRRSLDGEVIPMEKFLDGAALGYRHF